MIAVLGAGAFGTALAVVLAKAGRPVTLWARDINGLSNGTSPRLPDIALPPEIAITDNLQQVGAAELILAAVPMQALAPTLDQITTTAPIVAACKGVDLRTLTGPSGVIQAACPGTIPAILSGPSFAADIARGMPTALSLACAEDATGAWLQTQLSTQTLRLYRTTDVTGVELAGALKNVIAIACGTAIGAGLGESARAALMTRGYAELRRLATALGAEADTLAGLAGFGDLALTCTSVQSRNYRFGLSLGDPNQPAPTSTVEGRATAEATLRLAQTQGIDMPITTAVAALVTGRTTVHDAMTQLMTRTLKEE